MYYLTFASNSYLRKLKIEVFRIKYQTSLLLTRYNTFLFFILLLSYSSIVLGNAMADTSNHHATITIQYTNDTAIGYTINVSGNHEYTISQIYSWQEDSSSRYNLQSYSIDNGPVIPVNRASDGNFTLDVSVDSDHVIVFIAKPQFRIVIHGTDNAIFFPPSPTNDDWFDDNTDVQFIIPNIVPSDKQNTRLQLDGWSLDDSYINAIPRQESGAFKSGTIHMSSAHNVRLEYKTQYYVNVISSFGRSLGTGWYNSGTIVDASVIPGNDIIVNHIFSGWQGSTIGNQNQIFVETLADSPKVLVANWSVDYTNISIIVICVIAALVFGIIYQKRLTPFRT
jgi:hypothetical protein